MDFDVVIIGGGPAALTCAIYASRGNLKVAFIEKMAPGGKVVATAKIENWPGDDFVEGPDLAIRMYQHAIKFGAKHLFGEVTKVTKIAPNFFEIFYSSNNQEFKVSAKAVVIASGMINKKPLFIQNILDYENKGVSYCVVCDGYMFKDQPSAIIGAGNSAVEEATYLSSVASKVYVIASHSKLVAEQILIDKLLSRPNVEVILNAKGTKVIGSQKGVEGLYLDVGGEEKFIEVNSIFPYIGFAPSANFVKDFDIFAPSGFIQTDENMQTSVEGLFAIGDIRQKDIRQITTATSDGTIVGKILTNLL